MFDISKAQPLPQDLSAPSQPTPQQGFDISKAQPLPQSGNAGVNNTAGSPNLPPPGLGDTKALSFLTGFTDSVTKLTAGIVKAITPADSAINKSMDATRAAISRANTLSSAINPISTTAGHVAGMVAKSAPAAIALGGMSIPAQIAGYTAASALEGALENPENGQTRGSNAAMGGIAGLAGSTAGGLVQGIAHLIPATQIAKFASQGTIKPEVESAAKNLGIEVSPFEASNSATLKKALQDKTIMTPDKIEGISKHLAAREDKLKGVFNDIMKSVEPAKGGKTQSEIYAELNPRQIAPEHLGSIIPQEGKPANYVQRLYQEAHTESRVNWENIKPGSFEDLHEVSKYISKVIKGDTTAMETAGKQGVSSGIKGAEAKSLREAQGKIKDAMMTVSKEDELPVANELAKKKGFMTNIAAKVQAVANQGEEPSAIQILKAVAGTKAKEAYFLKSIANRGGDVQKAKDFLEVTKTIQKSPVQKLLDKPMKSSDFAISTKDVGTAGILGYVTNPVIAGGTFLGSIAKRGLTSKAYYNQIFKELPGQKALSAVEEIPKK